MFTNYKKHHPNYKPFLQENQFGLKLMMDALQYAFKKYEEFTSSDLRFFNMENRSQEKLMKHLDNWAIWLSPDVRDQIISFIQGKEYKPTEWSFIRNTHYNQGEYEFHIHGLLKLGDLSKNDLDDDIEMFHSNNNQLRVDMFDYTKAICVGLFFKKDGYGYNLSPADARHVHFSIDVSDVLIRMLTQNKFKNDHTQIIEGIARCIFNKMIKWELIKFNMFKIIYDNSSCIKLGEEPVKTIPGSDLIRLLIVYKYYYDMVNGIISASSDYKSLDDHLDAIDYQLKLMGFTNGQFSIMNSVHHKISNNFLNEKRIIDQDIDQAFDLCRFMLKDSYVVKPSGAIAVNNLVDNNGRITVIKNENIGTESSTNIAIIFHNYFHNIMTPDVVAGIEECYYPIDSSFTSGVESEDILKDFYYKKPYPKNILKLWNISTTKDLREKMNNINQDISKLVDLESSQINAIKKMGGKYLGNSYGNPVFLTNDNKIVYFDSETDSDKPFKISTFENDIKAEDGTEDLNISADYDTFIKNDRSMLLLKLNSNEKRLYIKYENEVMRLRGDISNCQTPEMQSILIDRSTSLSERINLEATKSHSEYLVAGLIVLDSYRNSITSELSKIDFDKRRKGMLYGVLKTKTNFDY